MSLLWTGTSQSPPHANQPTLHNPDWRGKWGREKPTRKKQRKQRTRKAKERLLSLRREDIPQHCVSVFPWGKWDALSPQICVQGALLLSNNWNIIIKWQNTQNQKMQRQSISPCVSLCGGRLTTGGEGHTERDGKWEKMAVVPQSMGSLLCGPMEAGGEQDSSPVLRLS